MRAALGESSIGARARMRTASDLVHRLPDTLDALQVGRLTPRLATAVVDTVQALDDTAAREVEQAVLPEPGQITDPVPTQAAFRTRLRRARIKADPRSAEEKAARAAEDRDVWVIPQENAMAHLGAALPAEGATTVMAAVHAKADQIKTTGDARTKAQRRADGLVQICADYLDNEACKIKNDTGDHDTSEAVRTRAGAQAPRYHGLRPQIQISVALSTLLGLDEQPADLEGHGPIPADVARRIAADPTGTWRRLVTDKLGRLVDYGRSTYKPPPDLAQFVIARDRTCQGPGCAHPAARSDLHHLIAFSRGGHTNAKSLIAAEERHHYAVHDGQWTVERLPDGTIEWTSPTGHVYHRTPDPYPVDTTCKIKNDTGDTDTNEPDNKAAADSGEGGTPTATTDTNDEEGAERPPF